MEFWAKVYFYCSSIVYLCPLFYISQTWVGIHDHFLTNPRVYEHETH